MHVNYPHFANPLFRFFTYCVCIHGIWDSVGPEPLIVNGDRVSRLERSPIGKSPTGSVQVFILCCTNESSWKALKGPCQQSIFAGSSALTELVIREEIWDMEEFIGIGIQGVLRNPTKILCFNTGRSTDVTFPHFQNRYTGIYIHRDTQRLMDYVPCRHVRVNGNIISLPA